MRKMIFGITTAALLASGFTHEASAQSGNYYQGKTLTILVGLEAGGTSDLFARSFSQYLRKYIPGSPNIIVQNMPGGAGLVATNFLAERAKNDGMTILWGPWDPLAQAIGGAGGYRVRYEKLEYLGGTGDVRVNYARTDSVPGGMKKAADIVKAELITTGETNATAISGLMARLALDTLGVKNRLILGYRGGADVFLGLQRSELQFHNTSITTFRSRSAAFVKSGEGIGINYYVPVDEAGNYERNKAITEMPAFPDLYKEIYGKMPSGPTWDALNWLTNQVGELTFIAFAPPETPAPVVSILREAYEKASLDKDFTAETVKQFGLPYSFVGPDRGAAILKSLANVSPQVLDTLKKTIESGQR